MSASEKERPVTRKKLKNITLDNVCDNSIKEYFFKYVTTI